MRTVDHLSFHPDYELPLPEGHAFPMRKYGLLRDLLVAEGLANARMLHEPEECPWELLALAHDAGYLAKLRDGGLSRDEERRIGIAWSPRLVRRARLAVGGTLDAARAALSAPSGRAANLAGGTHHALRDRGEGYCTLNDVAVSVLALRAERGLDRVLVIDLDVHHGNGNAAMFADDPRTFTFSMHGRNNFPLRKPPSDLDVPLEDGTGDDLYLELLERHLPEAFARSKPELAFYLAGVDVARGDRFGRLALTAEGIARRDRLVLSTLRAAGVPVCVTMAGGYALGDDRRTSAERTAWLHAIVHREARSLGSAEEQPDATGSDRD
ncbi:MAG: hypothetical protein RIS86_475 [Planctomycetota bacterium]